MEAYASLLAEIGIDICVEAEVVQATEQEAVLVKCCEQFNNTMETDGFMACWTCGKIDRLSQTFVTQLNQKPDFFGRRNCGFSLYKKRFYQAHTNLKDHFQRLLGYSLMSIPCAKWNETGKCYSAKCKNIHRCANCYSRHRSEKCPIPRNWRMVMTRQFDWRRRDAYSSLKKYLKENRLSSQYKNIFAILYSLGGPVPVISPRQHEQIVSLLREVYWFYCDGWQKIVRDCGSLGSALMILKYVLETLEIDYYYTIPDLKTEKARTRVNEFISAFVEYRIKSRE